MGTLESTSNSSEVSCVKINDEVIIQFWDHAMGDVPILAKTWGIVRKSDKKSVTISTWHQLDCSKEDRKENDECFTIIKSAIVWWALIEPGFKNQTSK